MFNIHNSYVILNYLGYLNFIHSSGLSDLKAIPGGLIVKLPNDLYYAKGGINKVTITTLSDNNFRMVFERETAADYRLLCVVDNVSNERLRYVFSKKTGLAK
ncbi:hypothetical protein [Shewanella algae]|uniref:hypothetical protein n=1 Tax=Shewanella algae TaxID=38313 RepID=UPI0031F5AE83